jgi:uncharacterized protein (DUF1778 family)
MAQQGREQLNIRVDAERFLVLETAAQLEGWTLAEYVKDLIDHRYESLLNDKQLMTTVEVKRERTAVRTGKVPRLQDRREEKEASS